MCVTGCCCAVSFGEPLTSVCLLQYDKALEFYDKAVEAQPAHAEAHCNMGVIHKNQGRLEEAVAAYERALAAAPNFQIVRSNLAIALTEKATLVKADGDFEKSEPSAAGPQIQRYCNLGSSCYLKGWCE